MMLLVAEIVALLFAGYPFMVGENAGIDPLYRLFGIPNRDVVKGRYVVAMLLTGTMLVIGARFYWLVCQIYPQEDLWKTLLLVGPSLFYHLADCFFGISVLFQAGLLQGKSHCQHSLYRKGCLPGETVFPVCWRYMKTLFLFLPSFVACGTEQRCLSLQLRPERRTGNASNQVPKKE